MKKSPLPKITRFIAGFLVSILVFAIFLKLFNSFFWATICGLIINGGASYFIIKKSRPAQPSHTMNSMAYGALFGTAVVIMASILIWLIADSAFSGIAD